MVRARLWKQFAAEKEHMGEMRKNGIDPWDDEDLPLFPDKEVNEVTADAMVALVDTLAEFSGESLTNAEGVRRFGRHSWRSTGAVWLTGVMMIEVTKLQMMARWSSPVVTHYTRLAPLRAITSDFRKNLIKRQGDAKNKKEKLAMTRSISKLTLQLTSYQAELDELKVLIKNLESRDPVKKYVVNTDSNIWHRVLTYREDAGLDAKTVCTWKYLRGACRLSAEAPTVYKPTCERCLPALKASLKG